MFVLFHLRLALAGADTCSQLVLIIMFTYNKYVVIDTFYFMFNWLTNTMRWPLERYYQFLHKFL